MAPGASVVGEVEIGKQSSIWYGCVLRGKRFFSLSSVCFSDFEAGSQGRAVFNDHIYLNVSSDILASYLTDLM